MHRAVFFVTYLYFPFVNALSSNRFVFGFAHKCTENHVTRLGNHDDPKNTYFFCIFYISRDVHCIIFLFHQIPERFFYSNVIIVGRRLSSSHFYGKKCKILHISFYGFYASNKHLTEFHKNMHTKCKREPKIPPFKAL